MCLYTDYTVKIKEEFTNLKSPELGVLCLKIVIADLMFPLLNTYFR